MGKYDPISTFLSNQRKKKHILSFRQVEKLIGTQLPTSARKYVAWWSGNSATWVQGGWRAVPDLRKKKVTF